MNIEKYEKKEKFFALSFIVIGLLAGVAGYVFHYEKDLMSSLTMGFLPTGIGVILIHKIGMKNPDFHKNAELENEERNIYINTKAGHTAFWISFYYIFAAIILQQLVDLSLSKFLIVTLVFMPVVYFLSIILYHKKY